MAQRRQPAPPLAAAALGEPKARPFNLINWKHLTAKGGDNYINYQQILRPSGEFQT